MIAYHSPESLTEYFESESHQKRVYAVLDCSDIQSWHTDMFSALAASCGRLVVVIYKSLWLDE